MGGPQSWMEQCDVICMNRYWGWYVLGGELDKLIDTLITTDQAERLSALVDSSPD